ncbi:MAG: DUF6174 domain-containing protein [Planctomycetia bacterium]|nr:DUF6174 domain-containing protein [Planctomycetia bacterium]
MTEETPAPPSSAKAIRLNRVVSRLVIGMLLGLGVAFAVTVFLAREQSPPLTRPALDAAAAQWSKRGPADYDLDLETQGAGNDRIHLEVRSTQPTACTVNGVPPKDRRVWATWTVPRQFDYIREDLARDAGPGAFLHAEFDADYGYPRRYRHVERAGGKETGWNITKFEPRAK